MPGDKKQKWYENKFVEMALSALIGAAVVGIAAGLFSPFRTMKEIKEERLMERLVAIENNTSEVDLSDILTRLDDLENWRSEEAESVYFYKVTENGNEILEIKQEDIVDLSEELEDLNSRIGMLILLEYRLDRLEKEVDTLQ